MMNRLLGYGVRVASWRLRDLERGRKYIAVTIRIVHKTLLDKEQYHAKLFAGALIAES